MNTAAAKKVLAAMVVTTFLVAGCSANSFNGGNVSVRGTVVEKRLGDSSEAAPRAGKGVVITALTAPDGTLAAETQTDEDGNFELMLKPGAYTVGPTAGGHSTACVQPISIEATAGQDLDLGDVESCPTSS